MAFLKNNKKKKKEETKNEEKALEPSIISHPRKKKLHKFFGKTYVPNVGIWKNFNFFFHAYPVKTNYDVIVKTLKTNQRKDLRK